MDDPQIEEELPTNLCNHNDEKQCEYCCLFGCDCAGIEEEDE